VRIGGRRIRWAIAVALAVGLAAGGYDWHYQATHFLTVSDAHVTGHVVYIYPTASGILATWHAPLGTWVRARQVLGSVRTPEDAALPTEPCGVGSFIQPLAGVAVTAPVSGFIVQDDAERGEQVDPSLGLPLAAEVEPNQLWVQANVAETQIWKVRVGQRVDVHVDAFPGRRFAGRVAAIQQATQSAFSLLPPADTSGTFTKVTQRLPVKIVMGDTRGLFPGMSAEVRIHLR
jgi:multidrug resistance efflux pump